METIVLDDWISVGEASKLLPEDVWSGHKSLYYHIHSGRLKAIKVGGFWLVNRESFKTFIEDLVAGKIKPGPAAGGENR